MVIDKKQVEHIAKLSRIKLSEEEKIEKQTRDKRREKILKNVPEKENDYIKVKSVQ